MIQYFNALSGVIRPPASDQCTCIRAALFTADTAGTVVTLTGDAGTVYRLICDVGFNPLHKGLELKFLPGEKVTITVAGGTGTMILDIYNP